MRRAVSTAHRVFCLESGGHAFADRDAFSAGFRSPLRRHQRLDALTAGSCRERIVDAIEREAGAEQGFYVEDG